MDLKNLDFIKNDERLFTTTIEEIVYPLCLTVEANKLIDEVFGNIKNVGKVLQDYAEKEDTTMVMKLTSKLLSILVSGGLARCRIKAKMRGEEIELPDALEEDDLNQLFSFEDMPEIQSTVFAAMNGGAKRNVETAPEKSPKNGETTTSSD